MVKKKLLKGKGQKRKKSGRYPTYDRALKLLFSHPEMMKALIQGFVPEPWVKDLALSTLERINVAHVADNLEARDNDMVWRIKFRGQWLYLVFITEFQSDIERFMAVRILTYMGLIYQDLLKGKKKYLADGRLPLVFSMVFYTGDQEWNAPVQLKDCISSMVPPGLAKYQPNFEYMLLDVGHLNLEQCLVDENNLLLPVVKLEQASDGEEISPIIQRMTALFKSEQFNSLRRSLLTYVKRAIKFQERFPEAEANSLEEIDTMLQERMDQWEKNWLQQGRQEGRQEGRQQGEATLLLRQLQRKFGEIPSDYRAKIESADPELLLSWGERLLEAPSFEELFNKVH